MLHADWIPPRFGIFPIAISSDPKASAEDKLGYAGLYTLTWNGAGYTSFLDDDLPQMQQRLNRVIGTRYNTEGLRSLLQRLLARNWIMRKRVQGHGRNYWRTFLLIAPTAPRLVEHISASEGNVIPAPAVASDNERAYQALPQPNERACQALSPRVLYDDECILDSDPKEKIIIHPFKNADERACQALSPTFALFESIGVRGPNLRKLAETVEYERAARWARWLEWALANPGETSARDPLKLMIFTLVGAKDLPGDPTAEPERYPGDGLDDETDPAMACEDSEPYPQDEFERDTRELESAIEQKKLAALKERAAAGDTDAQNALELSLPVPDLPANPSSLAINTFELWHAVLSELQLQMTKETFDTWLRHSFAIGFDGDTMVVGVHSIYAKQLIESRLSMTIQRTITGIVGQPIDLKYLARRRNHMTVTARGDGTR